MARKIIGRRHTEEDCIYALRRKGIVVNEFTVDRDTGERIPAKEIGIPKRVKCGNKIWGRLDFMRLQGWSIIKNWEAYFKTENSRKNTKSKKGKYERRKRSYKGKQGRL